MTGAAPVYRRTVRVQAASRGYDVVVGASLLKDIGPLARMALPSARRAAIFFDHGLIRTHTLETAADSLRTSGFDAVHTAPMVFTPSEAAKSLANVGHMLAALTELRLDRNDLVVSIGGGVLGDMAGFAAATYRRGIAWINLPTTLLSMVDASVGGKTGTNLLVDGSLKKNMIGAFWQPHLVVADVTVLSSLPDRHFRAGLAECIKHGMLSAAWGDPDLAAWTDANLDRILKRDAAALVELVARNVAVKAAVVGTDEREEAPDADGGRALLNLGHTFGHVLESLQEISPDGDPRNAPLQHGEAVALGLVAACACSKSLGLCSAATAERLRTLLGRAALPTTVQGLPEEGRLLELMHDDKKVAGGKLRLVLPLDAGICRVVPDPPREAVLTGWRAIRRHA